MRNDPMYKTVCDRCYQGTWYETEGPCHRSRLIYCGECRQAKGEGPCGGTLRVIDRSGLAPSFTRYYESGERVRVLFSYGETMTGTIGKTMGWKPSYMLMRRSSDHSSPYLLSAADRVVAVQHGRKYLSFVA